MLIQANQGELGRDLKLLPHLNHNNNHASSIVLTLFFLEAQSNLAARRDTWRCEPWLVNNHRASPSYCRLIYLAHHSFRWGFVIFDTVKKCSIKAKIGKEETGKRNEKNAPLPIYIRSHHLIKHQWTLFNCNSTAWNLSFINRHHRLISLAWVVDSI